MRRLLTVLIAAGALLGAISPATAGAATNQFPNTAPISIADLNQGSPSPSEITVSGVPGVITDLNVYLEDVSHSNPDDFEILLVGPFGQAIMLMNDAGGAVAINTLDFSFNDEGLPLPDAGPINAGQGYEPADHSGAAFPGEHHLDVDSPDPPYALALSFLDGTSPNGLWKLFTADDNFNANAGNIAGGWRLEVVSTDPPPAPPAPITPAPLVINQPTSVATPVKKCKKGRKLKRGKCVKKRKK